MSGIYTSRNSRQSAGAVPHAGTSQVHSALGSLKRSWSGNQHDLGNTGDTAKPNKLVKAPESSQEIFYEWSDTPSPPSPALASARPSLRTGSDKENALEVRAQKRVYSEPSRGTAGLQAGHQSSRANSQTGFVSAASLYKAGSRESVSASGARSSGASTVPSKTTASSTADLAARYSYGTNGSTGRSASPSIASSSMRGTTPTGTASNASRTMPWLKSASQLRDEKRSHPNSYLSSSIVNSTALINGALSNSPLASPTLGAADAKTKSVSKIFLSSEQRAVLQMVVEHGKNTFFTGSAGTGKSVLLREIIRELRTKYAKKPDAVAVTASTGIAACNIGGVTVHSFAGIGLGKEPVPQLVAKIRKNRKAANRWMRTQVLIVDEISMVDPVLLDKLDEIAKTMKKQPGRPFGGIQIVITGDFFQLPPVNPGGGVTFAFEAKCWNTAIENKVNLTQVFRQKDSTFVTMLNEMRFGRLSQKTIQTFKTLERTPQYDAEIVPTELFPMRNEVDQANMGRLHGIEAECKTYRAVDSGTLQGEQREKVLSNCMALPCLMLKKGAQVMLIKNIDETLVNGSIGKVVDFVDEHEWSIMAEEIGEEQEQNKEERNKVVRVSQMKWPLVRFHLANGGTRNYLAKPEAWKTELPDGEVQASRTQVPLILAWAISIHKSQGQTLPCCKINLNRVFEKGQAYVALSRATSLEGLQVLGFRPDKVMAHPKVVEWSRSLLALQSHAA